jgi:hypothetical protein
VGLREFIRRDWGNAPLSGVLQVSFAVDYQQLYGSRDDRVNRSDWREDRWVGNTRDTWPTARWTDRPAYPWPWGAPSGRTSPRAWLPRSGPRCGCIASSCSWSSPLPYPAYSLNAGEVGVRGSSSGKLSQPRVATSHDTWVRQLFSAGALDLNQFYTLWRTLHRDFHDIAYPGCVVLVLEKVRFERVPVLGYQHVVEGTIGYLG